MHELLDRTLEQLLGRLEGPMHARFILQPIMASLIAIRAGFNDVKTSQPAYLSAIISTPDARGRLLRSGWKEISKVFLVAFALDCIYQFVVLRWFYPIQSLIIAFVLAVVPYAMIRGPAARIIRRVKFRKPV